MKFTWRWSSVIVVGTLLFSTAAPLEAQQASEPPHQVISANPFGLQLELFNAEYERKVSGSATAGAGGSFLSNRNTDYVNADVFYRFYPAAKPLQGWAFGVKAGLTRLSNSKTCFGYGFDTNWSWLMGKNDNFYVGAGFGLKRLFGERDSDLKYVPTFRIINVGIAFK